MSEFGQSTRPKYAVNGKTGQVAKLTPSGWAPVKSAKNDRGDIVVFENGAWQPVSGLSGNPEMTSASKRANAALAAGQPVGQADLTQLGKLDFSGAAMARLPAPTMSPEQLDAFDAQRAAEKESYRVPDNNLKERLIIGSNIGTFGHGPQAMAGASTLGALLATPFVEGDIIDREGVSGAMSSFLDDARVHQRRGREERPIESYGGEIVGGLLQGKTIIDNLGHKLLPKTNTVSNVTRVMGTGLGYGSLYGFGQSESDNIEGALGDAAFGGALGAGTGLAFKAAEPAVTATYRAGKTGVATLSDALSAALGKAGTARDRVAEDVAIAAVRRSMQRSGMTFDEIMEQVKRYEGKPAVLAEVIGQDAVNALTALTRRPGSTPQKAQAIIEERTFARPERMRGDVEDATGIPIGQLDETLQTQLTERQAAAKPMYDALYKRFSTIESFRQPGQTGQVMKRINRLARTPLAQRHLQLAKDAVATIAARRGIAVSKMSKMEYWDLVKRSLDDAIDSAKAKGEARTRVGEGIEDLVGLKNDLVDELDRLTGGAYAAAREVGGEAPRLKAAAVAGQKVMQARNPREVAKTVAATLSQDLPALRAGVVDDLGTRIDKGMLPSRVRVPDVAGKLRASLGDESANKLINKFDAEAALSETGSRWAPRLNSVTGTVMESGATQMGDDLINAGFNLATGNKLGLVRQAINFMRQRGFSQRQIDAIGDLLLSSPQEGLKRLRVMAPDGVPTGAAAPLAGGGDGGGLPPGGGGSPVPAPTPSTPIRAGGFGGASLPLGDVARTAAGGVGGNVYGRFNDVNGDGVIDERDAEAGTIIGTALGGASALAPRITRRLLGSGRLSSDVSRRGGKEYSFPLEKGQSKAKVVFEPDEEGRATLVSMDFEGAVDPTAREIHDAFQKTFRALEDHATRFGNPVYTFGTTGVGQQRAYLRAIQKNGAPEGYQAFYSERDETFYIVKNDRVAKLIASDEFPSDARWVRKGQSAVKGTGKGFGPQEAQRAISEALPGLRTDLGNAAVGAGVGALGPADSPEERLRNMAIGAGVMGVGGRISRTVGARNALAGETRTAGLGGRGPKKPPGKRDIGTKVADASAIAALSLAPPAQAQGGGSAELDAANERVRVANERVLQIEKTAIPQLEADLRLLEDPNADARKIQTLLANRDFDLGPNGVDGRIGPDTRKAIASNVREIKGEIAFQRQELEKARKEEAAARDGVKQVEMRAAQAAAQSNPVNTALNKAAPWVGAAAGIYLGYRTRGRAVAKSRIAAQEAAKRANALLNPKPVSRGINTPDSVNTRAANLNEFWRLGGAGENVPFRANQSGKWSARPKAAEPSSLYAAPGRFNSQDAAIIGTGVAEAGVAHTGVKDQEKKIQQAKADVERYAAAGDVAGMQRALKRQQEAEVMRDLFVIAERAGLFLSLSRVSAGLKNPYAKVSPDVAAAERERALILQALKK